MLKSFVKVEAGCRVASLLAKLGHDAYMEVGGNVAASLRFSQSPVLLKPHTIWISRKRGYCERSVAICWKSWQEAM